MCGCARQCDQQLRLSMSNPMGSKISVQIERALLGKSSDVGISALGIDSGRMTGNSDVTRLGKGCRQHTQNRCISLMAACGFSKKWTDEILYLAGLSIPSKYSVATAHIRAVRIGFPFDPTNERRWFSGSLNSFAGNFSLKTCVHHRRTLYVNGFARRVRLRANTIGTKVR